MTNQSPHNPDAAVAIGARGDGEANHDAKLSKIAQLQYRGTYIHTVLRTGRQQEEEDKEGRGG